MRLRFVTRMLLAEVCIVSGLCAEGQQQREPFNEAPLEIAVNLEAARANTVPAYNFWMEGGGVQVAGKIRRHWEVAADLSVLHAGQLPRTTNGLDLITAVFGPRYSATFFGGRIRVYGQAMGGAGHGSNSLFPNPNGATSSASGVALLVGGGSDYRVSHHLSVRMLDAGWLRTELSNGTTTVENNLRVGSGVVFLF